MPLFCAHEIKTIIITSPKCGSTSILKSNKYKFESIEFEKEEYILDLFKKYQVVIVYRENIIKRFLSGFYEDLINNSCYDNVDLTFEEYVCGLYNIYLNKTQNVSEIYINDKIIPIYWGECSNKKINITDNEGNFISHIQSQEYAMINFINIFDETYNVKLLELNNLSILTGEKKHNCDKYDEIHLKNLVY